VTPEDFRKFDFKILSSGAISAEKLASVGVQNNNSETRKLMLHNEMTTASLPGHSRGTRVYSGAQAPSGSHPLELPQHPDTPDCDETFILSSRTIPLLLK